MMIEFITKYRVPYVQVDRMGFLYHSHYLELFDMGRCEFMRNYGLTNLEIEEQGYQLPVCKAEVTYMRPALYDDLLEIHTQIKQLPEVTVTFDYEIYRHVSPLSDEIESTPITRGKVKLAFMNARTKQAVRPPQFIIDKLRPLFKDSH